jgi:hypothetical protein
MPATFSWPSAYCSEGIRHQLCNRDCGNWYVFVRHTIAIKNHAIHDIPQKSETRNATIKHQEAENSHSAAKHKPKHRILPSGWRNTEGLLMTSTVVQLRDALAGLPGKPLALEHVSRIARCSRNVVEKQKAQRQFPLLNLYCNWLLHSQIDKSATADQILAAIDDILFVRQKVTTFTPQVVKSAMRLQVFRSELASLLKANCLPDDLVTGDRRWKEFEHLNVRLLLHRGRRPYMAHLATSHVRGGTVALGANRKWKDAPPSLAPTPLTRRRRQIRWSSSQVFQKSTSSRLVGVGFDTGRRVDHRLLADNYEAGVWPIKILDQQYHHGNQHCHNVDWQPHTAGL